MINICCSDCREILETNVTLSETVLEATCGPCFETKLNYPSDSTIELSSRDASLSSEDQVSLASTMPIIAAAPIVPSRIMEIV